VSDTVTKARRAAQRSQPIPHPQAVLRLLQEFRTSLKRRAETRTEL
jgi:hypothetical protein